jgi:Tfp pilus assembly protein PilP
MRKMHYLQLALALSLCLCGGCFFTQTAFAEDKGGDGKFRVNVVNYNPEGRRDPFFSIIEAAAKEQEKAEAAKLKSPIENYDLSQFKLIAILWDDKQRLALVGLPDDKYYTIKVGMTAGIHQGKVLKIEEDSVTFREIRPDFRGDMRPEDYLIKLREEEE